MTAPTQIRTSRPRKGRRLCRYCEAAIRRAVYSSVAENRGTLTRYWQHIGAPVIKQAPPHRPLPFPSEREQQPRLNLVYIPMGGRTWR